MKPDENAAAIRRFWSQTLAAHGATPQGVDWNSAEAQVIRFEQLARLLPPGESFSLIDWGCGYGALVDFLDGREMQYTYTGYDLLESMINEARQRYADHADCTFTAEESGLAEADFTVSSGIFNRRFDNSEEAWLEHILNTLQRFNTLSRRGFAFNLLTRYSDPQFMRPDLYYADPLMIFDYCKKHFARNVALLHDYDLYDFTILVRKIG